MSEPTLAERVAFIEGKVIYIGNQIDKLVGEKFPAPNSSMLKCTCYSTSFNSEGAYFLVRNDCPIHKGTLQQ